MTTETSGTAVALRPSGRLAITDDQDYWTPEQYAGLKALGIKGATEGDLAVFFHQCRRTRLDPFSRQIYLIPRREKQRWQDENGQWHEQWVNKQTIQVGIDGFRVMRDRVAERTGTLAEFEDTVWYDADGTEHKVWLADEPPAACRVVLVKHDLATGRALRFPAVLRTKSYMQVTAKGEPVSQWRTQAEHMIEKCCEAFATRRAFPNEFSGVYLEEEMQGRQAESAQAAPVRRVTAGEVLGRSEPSNPVAKQEVLPGDQDDSAGQEAAERTVTAQLVNDHFKRLGFTVRDKSEVLAAAASIADRKLPLASIGDLTGDQLTEVHDRLDRCETRDDVMELLVAIAESRGAARGDPGDAAQAAAERAFGAGEAGE